MQKFRLKNPRLTLIISILLILNTNPAIAQNPNSVIWTKPQSIVDDFVNPNGYLGHVVSPDGNDQIAAWDNCAENLKCEIRVVYSNDRGKSWSKPMTVWSAPWSGKDTGIYRGGWVVWRLTNSTDGKTASMAINWMRYFPGTQNVTMKSRVIIQSNNGGRSWTSPLIISNREFDPTYETPQILWDEGENGGPAGKQFDGSRDYKTQIMTFTDAFRATNGTLYFRSMVSLSKDSGKTFSIPKSIPELIGDSEESPIGYIAGTHKSTVNMSDSGQKIIITWSDWYNNLYSSASTDAGQSWSKKSLICSACSGVITTSANFDRAFAISSQNEIISGQSFYVAKSYSSFDGGISWNFSSTLPISPVASEIGSLEVTPGTAAVIESQNKLFVSLTQSRGDINSRKLWTTISIDGGKNWSSPREESSGWFVQPVGLYAPNSNGVLQFAFWTVSPSGQTLTWNYSENFGLTWKNSSVLKDGYVSRPQFVVASRNALASVVYFYFYYPNFYVTSQTFDNLNNKKL